MRFAFKLNVPLLCKECCREAGRTWFQVLFLPSFTFVFLLYSNLYIRILHKIFTFKKWGQAGIGYQ